MDSYSLDAFAGTTKMSEFNLEELNLAVGKKAGLDVKLNEFSGECVIMKPCMDHNGDVYSIEWNRFDPTHNAQQCLDLTPFCDVLMNDSYSWSVRLYDKNGESEEDWFEGTTELIARCLAFLEAHK